MDVGNAQLDVSLVRGYMKVESGAGDLREKSKDLVNLNGAIGDCKAQFAACSRERARPLRVESQVWVTLGPTGMG
jgi:hypothetical protein